MKPFTNLRIVPSEWTEDGVATRDENEIAGAADGDGDGVEVGTDSGVAISDAANEHGRPRSSMASARVGADGIARDRRGDAPFRIELHSGGTAIIRGFVEFEQRGPMLLPHIHIEFSGVSRVWWGEMKHQNVERPLVSLKSILLAEGEPLPPPVPSTNLIRIPFFIQVNSPHHPRGFPLSFRSKHGSISYRLRATLVHVLIMPDATSCEAEVEVAAPWVDARPPPAEDLRATDGAEGVVRDMDDVAPDEIVQRPRVLSNLPSTGYGTARRVSFSALGRRPVLSDLLPMAPDPRDASPAPSSSLASSLPGLAAGGLPADPPPSFEVAVATPLEEARAADIRHDIVAEEREEAAEREEPPAATTISTASMALAAARRYLWGASPEVASPLPTRREGSRRSSFWFLQRKEIDQDVERLATAVGSASSSQAPFSEPQDVDVPAVTPEPPEELTAHAPPGPAPVADYVDVPFVDDEVPTSSTSTAPLKRRMTLWAKQHEPRSSLFSLMFARRSSIGSRFRPADYTLPNLSTQTPVHPHAVRSQTVFPILHHPRASLDTNPARTSEPLLFLRRPSLSHSLTPDTGTPPSPSPSSLHFLHPHHQFRPQRPSSRASVASTISTTPSLVSRRIRRQPLAEDESAIDDDFDDLYDLRIDDEDEDQPAYENFDRYPSAVPIDIIAPGRASISSCRSLPVSAAAASTRTDHPHFRVVLPRTIASPSTSIPLLCHIAALPPNRVIEALEARLVAEVVCEGAGRVLREEKVLGETTVKCESSAEMWRRRIEVAVPGEEECAGFGVGFEAVGIRMGHYVKVELVLSHTNVLGIKRKESYVLGKTSIILLRA
ncbi:hypothetical protein HK101_006675 [Irineochytrium annulatum]|nr:hypothetical protein HK101_006675 [Irineochytrium annulatum]